MRSRTRLVMAWTRASARSGEWDGPRSGVQVHIWSSRDGNRPTWCTRPPYRGTGQALFVERCDGFGADEFSAPRVDGPDGQVSFDGVGESRFDHLSSGVVLDDYHGCIELVVEVYDAQCPAIRGQTGGLVCQDVYFLAPPVGSGDDDSGLGAGGLGGESGVDGDDDAGHAGAGPEPRFLYPLAFPECVFVLVDELGVDLLASEAGAVVLFDEAV